MGSWYPGVGGGAEKLLILSDLFNLSNLLDWLIGFLVLCLGRGAEELLHLLNLLSLLNLPTGAAVCRRPQHIPRFLICCCKNHTIWKPSAKHTWEKQQKTKTMRNLGGLLGGLLAPSSELGWLVGSLAIKNHTIWKPSATKTREQTAKHENKQNNKTNHENNKTNKQMRNLGGLLGGLLAPSSQLGWLVGDLIVKNHKIWKPRAKVQILHYLFFALWWFCFCCFVLLFVFSVFLVFVALGFKIVCFLQLSAFCVYIPGFHSRAPVEPANTCKRKGTALVGWFEKQQSMTLHRF